jgi:protoheme IX farnesyltransferase
MISHGPDTCALQTPAVAAADAIRVAGALLRLSKPGIVLAETVACLAGILLASPARIESIVLFWTLLSMIMAASGAAMANCLLEAERDRRMPRLAERSRALDTAGKELTLAVALMLIGGSILVSATCLNGLAALLLALGVASYLFLYTLWLKRRSPWGVLSGGIPGALPPLVGCAASTGSICGAPLLLSLVIFIWQPAHFWFLALQYRDQYQQAGMPILPLIHGDRLTKYLIMFFAIVLLPCTMALIRMNGSCSAGFAATVLLAGILFPLLCHRFLYRATDYLKGYFTSLAYLGVILTAIIADSALKIERYIP